MGKILRHPKLRHGSHLPVLHRMVAGSDGPILELGSGFYSTPFLHWACFRSQRRLCTYESNPAFHAAFNGWSCHWHRLVLIDDWDEVDVRPEWSVVLIDHEPEERRRIDISRVTHAKLVVVHDTEPQSERKYGYESVYGLYKYRYDFRDAFPHTSVLSNFIDPKELM